MRKTIIHPWTEEWGKLYSIEEKLLKNLFRDEMAAIFHIGSTSIPSIGFAKPVIDILIVVKNIEKVDEYIEKMQLLGYESRGENGITGRRYFPKGKENRTHHVHIYQVGNKNINKHLNFKNYLLKHLEDAKKFGELKVKLAKHFPNNTHKYQEGKEQFVKQVLEKATNWAMLIDKAEQERDKPL